MTDQALSSTLSVQSLADKYQVNVGKPFFPLNTLRLVYLIFMETIGTTDQAVVEKRAKDILALIPLVQGLLDARSAHRAEQTSFSLESEWEVVQPHIEQIYQIVDTPQVRDLFSYVFAYVFPLQDTLLLSLYNDLSNQKKFSAQDIYTIFHIRSMDSIIYSNIVGAILRRDIDPTAVPKDMQLSLNYKLNALYQLNDLVDAIVYAKEDMESKNFSPFELIKKASQDANEARQMIISIASAFEKRLQTFPLGESTEKLLNDFGHQLIGVIGGGSTVTSPTEEPMTAEAEEIHQAPFADSGHSPMEETLYQEDAAQHQVAPTEPEVPEMSVSPVMPQAPQVDATQVFGTQVSEDDHQA